MDLRRETKTGRSSSHTSRKGYELHLQSNGFDGNNLYPGAAYTFTDVDDTIEEINESITNIHLVHNVNTAATSAEAAALQA